MDRLDHLICDGDFGIWKCEICGDIYNLHESLNFPQPLWVVPALIKAFQNEHSGCDKGELNNERE